MDMCMLKRRNSSGSVTVLEELDVLAAAPRTWRSPFDSTISGKRHKARGGGMIASPAALQALGVNQIAQIARHRRHSCPAIVCPGHTPAIFVGHSSSPSEPDEAEARLGPAAPCGNDLQGAAAQRSSTLCAEGALKIAGAPVARWLAAPELSTGLELLPPHWGWQYLESMRTADVITRSIDRDGNFALPVEGGGRGNGNGKSREERGNGTVFTTTARATW